MSLRSAVHQPNRKKYQGAMLGEFHGGAACFASWRRHLSRRIVAHPAKFSVLPAPPPFVECGRTSWPTLGLAVLDLLLDVMHHGHCRDEDDRRDYLVRVKAGMEKTPCDAHCGQRLHHLE